VSRQLCHSFHSLFNIPRRLIEYLGTQYMNRDRYLRTTIMQSRRSLQARSCGTAPCSVVPKRFRASR
jgi:hypothetical protein